MKGSFIRNRLAGAPHRSEVRMKKKIEIERAPISAGSRYPHPFDGPCRNKLRRRLGLAAGLKQIGINLLELSPGAWSSQRHWHTHAEEFVYVLDGEVVLVTEGCEEILRAGDSAAFLPGDPDGQHLQIRFGARARFVEFGSGEMRVVDACFPDVVVGGSASGFAHK